MIAAKIRLPVESRMPTMVPTTGWSVPSYLTVPVRTPPVGSSATLMLGVATPAVTPMYEPSSQLGAPPGAATLKTFVTKPGADTRTL